MTLARRTFLELAVTGAASLAMGHASLALGRGSKSHATEDSNAQLVPGAFLPLPLGEVRPTGWLLRQLRIQADGMSGHLDEFWPSVGPDSGWLGGKGESWERGPYFLDGLVPLAYLLDDERLKHKAQRWIDWTLTHQAADGMIGPAGNNDWWPRMVMVKVLAQYYEVTSDSRVLPVLTKYFHHQLAEMPRRPLESWGRFRWQDEVLVLQWLYVRTHDPILLNLVGLLRQQGHDWEAQFANFKYTVPATSAYLHMGHSGADKVPDGMQTHGVNNGQALKTSAVLARLGDSALHREAFHRQLSALDRYHGTAAGMFTCDEHLAGTDPSQGTELCTVVETMFSLEVALAVFGDPAIADRLEKIAFNALPATFTDDMWAHQYDSQANQIQVGLNSKPWTTNGPESNLYGLEPNFGCCTANFHQGWPKFAGSLWMRSPDDGLVAALYSPSTVKTSVRGTQVTLVEETDYPFNGTVRISVEPARPAYFPLLLRIPSWAGGVEVLVNGKPTPSPVAAGSFARLERTWSSGDRVELRFPMQPRLTRSVNSAVTVERGPLTFSFSPGESWVKLRERGPTADWQIFPKGPWNYALAIDETSVADLPVATAVVGERPFSWSGTPVTIRVPARRLNEWRSQDGVAQPLPPSPAKSSEATETLTLVPYAAAKLRVTVFPQLDQSSNEPKTRA